MRLLKSFFPVWPEILQAVGAWRSRPLWIGKAKLHLCGREAPLYRGGSAPLPNLFGGIHVFLFKDGFSRFLSLSGRDCAVTAAKENKL